MVLNEGLGFDGIAVTSAAWLTPSAENALYLWSDETGLWASRGDGKGSQTRLAERCSGGIAATSFGADTYVGCSRTLSGPDNADSEVLVYQLVLGDTSAVRARALASVGRAGRDGHGVAVAADENAVYLAFHDGSLGAHTIALATLRAGTTKTAQLSRSGHIASEPALIAHGGHVYVAFAELELRPDGQPGSSVWLSRDGARAVMTADSHVYSPTPKLTADAQGLVLSYRDRSRLHERDAVRPGTRSELYVTRLDARGKRAGKVHAVGRANTDGEPSVFGCGALTTALLPREYGGERFVGINALDGALSSVGAGHQLYATGREFVLASGACVDGSWLLFAADRAPPGAPGSEAVSLRFSCKN